MNLADRYEKAWEQIERIDGDILCPCCESHPLYFSECNLDYTCPECGEISPAEYLIAGYEVKAWKP